MNSFWLSIMGFLVFIIISPIVIKLIQRSNLFFVFIVILIIGGFLGYVFLDNILFKYIYYIISLPTIFSLVLGVIFNRKKH